MKDFEIIDNLFIKNESVNYILSIQLLPDGFSFSIIDSLEEKLLVLKSKNIITDLESIQEDYYCQYMFDFIVQEELFKLDYKNVNIIYVTENSTLVPNSVLENDHLERVFTNNIDKPAHHKLLLNKINSIDASVIYSIPDCIFRVLNRQFSNISFYHQSVFLIENALEYNSNKNPVVFIHQSEASFDICIVDKGSMLVYNTYKYVKSDDIIYYAVNLIEQLSTNISINNIVLSGQVRRYKELIPNLNKFFKNIEFIKPQNKYTIPSSFDNIQLQDFNLLFINK